MGLFSNLFRKPRRSELVVVMYTRQGCHLCENAWRELESFRAWHHFALRAKDIDQTPELIEQFDTCVPVVEVNGKVRMRGVFNRVLFQRLLDAQASG